MANTVTVTLSQIAKEAADYHRLPFWVLWGTLGNETAFGHDIKTSSAGAVGVAQFIQSTAAAHNYPYTNSTDLLTITRQMLAAAGLLGELWNQTHDSQQVEEAYIGGHVGSGAHYPNPISSEWRRDSRPELTWHTTVAHPVAALLRGIGALHGAITEIGNARTQLAALTVPDHGRDPKDHSPKTKHTGGQLSQGGNHMRDHASYMRNVAQRGAPVKRGRLPVLKYNNPKPVRRLPARTIIPPRLPKWRQVKL